MDTILSVADAAKLLSCSPSLIFKLARDSKIELVKIGARSVIKQSELDRFIDTLEARPAKTERKSGRKPRLVK
jgi:excisionase family DNA binding protein